MFSAATRMTRATVAKMTAFSSRSAKASGALSSRHVCDAVRRRRALRGGGAAALRARGIREPRLVGAARPVKSPGEEPRRRLRTPRPPAAFSERPGLPDARHARLDRDAGSDRWATAATREAVIGSAGPRRSPRAATAAFDARGGGRSLLGVARSGARCGSAPGRGRCPERQSSPAPALDHGRRPDAPRRRGRAPGARVPDRPASRPRAGDDHAGAARSSHLRADAVLEPREQRRARR